MTGSVYRTIELGPEYPDLGVMLSCVKFTYRAVIHVSAPYVICICDYRIISLESQVITARTYKEWSFTLREL